MQPDLPDPVVPAMRRCGIRARSVQIAFPEMSLPSQTDERARARGKVAEDVAERDELRREVRDLDADGLLSGNRREDPDLRGRERVAQVVLEPCDLRHLRARRELQLVARHPRPGDLPGHARLHAELGQRTNEQVGGLRARVARRRRSRRRGAEQRAIGKPVLGVLGRCLERGLGALELQLGLFGDKERCFLRVRARTDDVRDRTPLRPAAGAGARRSQARGCGRPRRSATRSTATRTRGELQYPPASSRDPCDAGSLPWKHPSRVGDPLQAERPPMIAAPVCPMSAASVPPIARPMKPPESLPRSVIRPRKLTPTPRRNGRTSRRSLRASSSPPSATSATGSTYAALPMISVSTPASHEPTAPPSRPR